MKAVIKKELRVYFGTMYGYVFIGILLLLTGIISTLTNLLNGYSAFEYSLYNISYIFLLIVPILTMNILSDEKRTRTDQLLYSLPLSASDIILGKFIATAAVFAVPTVILCIYPLIFSLFGSVNFLSAYCAILGFYLMGCALLAFGLFVSSITESPVIAAVISFFSLLIMYLLGSIAASIPGDAFTSLLCFAVLAAALALLLYVTTKNETVSSILFVVLAVADIAVYFFNSTLMDGAFQKLLNALCVYERYSGFVTGILDLTAVVYYITFAFVFLFFAIQNFEKRRWN